MKKICIGLVFLLCTVSLHAQKTRMAQQLPLAKPGVNFPMTVHIYGLHFRTECWHSDCTDVLFADVTSNGRKLELKFGDLPEDPYRKTPLLSFGDLRARVLKNASGTQLGDKYELLLPDNRVLDCAVSGMFE